MKAKHLILLVVMNILWAASLSIYKNLSEHLTAGAVVTLRFGLAGLILLPFWGKMSGSSPKGIELVKTIFMGLATFCLGHRLQVYGDKLGGAANSSVLMGTEPILTTIAAAIFLRESIGIFSWLGFIVAMFGLAILNGLFGKGLQFAGLEASLIFMSSFLCEAVYSILGKKLIEKSGMLKTLTLALVFGSIGNVIFNGSTIVGEAKTMTVGDWLQVGYLATICTSIGYAIWFLVIRETDVNLTAMTIFVQPIAGVALAVMWLKEPLTWAQVFGCVAIMVGMVMGLRNSHKPKPLPPPD